MHGKAKRKRSTPRPAGDGYENFPAVKDYIHRIRDLQNAEVDQRNYRSIALQVTHGNYMRDRITIKLNKDGSVKVKNWINGRPLDATKASGLLPTDDEAAAIKAALADHKFPEPTKATQAKAREKQKELGVADQDWFEIWERTTDDKSGKRTGILTVQERYKKSDGTKGYRPWTFFKDGKWRPMEPDDRLPLWKPPETRNKAKLMIHEGAKAARFCDELVNNHLNRKARAAHPWAEELAGYEHWGWPGGAHNPHRADWSEVMAENPIEVVIVADHDDPGHAAVPRISRQLNLPTFVIQFTNDFAPGFDLADSFPDKLFKDENGVRCYAGPSMQALIEPATWATDQVKTGGKGRPLFALRQHFVKQWTYCNEPELFINELRPNIVRTVDNLSNALRRYSDASNTGQLLLANCEQVAVPSYSPDRQPGVIVKGTPSKRRYNVYQASSIEAVKGDIDPFMEFLDYLFPIETERYEAKRWIATLIARPGIRPPFGFLAISEQQGVGKTMLAEYVLTPLVGENNVSHPTEHDICESIYTGWQSNKRLAIVGELYQGHSWKAYNRLKSIITDPIVSVQEKYHKSYDDDNWIALYACSNSFQCVKAEETDRRWFVPTVTEVPWPLEKFKAFLSYLKTGGLQSIKYWAERDINHYLSEGERPPMTRNKQEIIDESRPDEQRRIFDKCGFEISEEKAEIEKFKEENKENPEAKYVGRGFCLSAEQELKTEVQRAKETNGQPVYSTAKKIEKIMVSAGMIAVKGHFDRDRIWWKDSYHHVCLSPVAFEYLQATKAEREVSPEQLRDWLIRMLEKNAGEM